LLYAVVAVHWRGGKSDGLRPVALKNPFSLLPVVGFAVFLGAVIVFGRIVGEVFGAGGALIGAAAVGLADIDSVTVSMARLVPAPLDNLDATRAILAAVASNMLSKLVIAATAGGGRFAGEVTALTVVCLAAGALGFWAAAAVVAG
jgi:uncharacterized membrane protein (DUF4010 family)